MWNLERQNKRINKTKQKQNHRYLQQADSCQRGGRCVGKNTIKKKKDEQGKGSRGSC